ncbi:hypothetical protein [Spiroplasma alleghenense]|uniref:Transmembrane protein n=1 Tax=Spiroplasma alleghenense TaxID=216931 RepID=A0A345Z4U6_9MOLU|nr:hypothetical protein [Spiroplasma alleghenense]AXK51625.1 hypothetical protein SALLE_v1c09550 [Spiroplasma alleghenense]
MNSTKKIRLFWILFYIVFCFFNLLLIAFLALFFWPISQSNSNWISYKEIYYYLVIAIFWFIISIGFIMWLLFGPKTIFNVKLKIVDNNNNTNNTNNTNNPILGHFNSIINQLVSKKAAKTNKIIMSFWILLMSVIFVIWNILSKNYQSNVYEFNNIFIPSFTGPIISWIMVESFRMKTGYSAILNINQNFNIFFELDIKNLSKVVSNEKITVKELKLLLTKIKSKDLLLNGDLLLSREILLRKKLEFLDIKQKAFYYYILFVSEQNAKVNKSLNSCEKNANKNSREAKRAESEYFRELEILYLLICENEISNGYYIY